MARSNSTKPPSYRLHKATGQAVCTIAHKDHYLGKHGTAESRIRYERLITAWMQNGTVPTIEPDAGTGITVAELCVMYLAWATGYYQKGGKGTSELCNVKRQIKGLRETYASLPAAEFSPLKLRVVRDRFVADGLARTNANRHTAGVIRIFSWAAERELIPPGIVHGLREVKSLPRGRSVARETDPVLPVDDSVVEATLPHLSPMVKAMVQIHALLACRPGELVTMRPCDIDMSRPVWVYTPQSHKSEHKGKSRIIPIGPRARLLLAPWLPAFPAQYVWPSQRSEHFTTHGYATAIEAGCLKAGIEPWSPNQLRHSGATRIREQAGLDAAQVILGHSNISTTKVYAEKNLDAAMQIALRIG